MEGEGRKGGSDEGMERVCVRERDKKTCRSVYLIKLHTAINGILWLVHLWIHMVHDCISIIYHQISDLDLL